MKRIKGKIKEKIYDGDYKLKKQIIMESNPDFADNSKYVFDEMIRRKLNYQYKIIWVVKNKKAFRELRIKNVKFLNRENGILDRVRFIYHHLKSKYIIDSNNFIVKMNKNQFRIHLTHGQPLKLATEYFSGAGEFDYMITTSEYFKRIFEDEFGVEKDKIKITGFPRTDVFFENENPVYLFPSIKRRQTIIWMPTYRNHKNWKNNSTFNMNIHFKYGVPSIENETQINELNELLKENHILLVLKLHPAEDTSKIRGLELSNIKLFEDHELQEKHVNIYNILPLTDALITDYSSVYHDYLFSDKPIGLAVADLKEYTKHVKLITGDYKSVIKGDYIESFEDLCKFIKSVSESKDISQSSRIEAKKMFNKYLDGKSSARVVDLLEENMHKEREK